MAVACTSSEKTEPCSESFPSSPLTSKPASESGSDNSSAVVSGSIDPSDPNYQSDSSVRSRKDADPHSAGYLKSEEYRLLFRLPPYEMLVQDFNCAFQESILLQGHMYLFVRHICFYSNIFGFETKKTIHLNEVTCVRKAKTAAIFPNAIEIVAGEKKYFFASFLSRDEAYRLIVDGWSEHTNGTEVLIDHQDLKSEIRSDDGGHGILRKVEGFEQQTNDLHLYDRSKDGNLPAECKLLTITEDDTIVSCSPLEVHENGVDAEPAVNADHFSSSEPFSKVEDTDAPKVPDYYTKVAESKFPVQVEEFFNLFFSDKAINFIDTFHRRCKDKDFRCTPWSAHAQFGHTREVSFQHPIKIYLGAKFGQCNEVQKFRIYNNSHLVIETSQEISDVPYSDYFRVEGLWVVERDDNETNSCCILRVYVNVAFSKKTMWKGKIEQSTIEECREAYSDWLNNAHELLKQKNLEKLDGETSAPDMTPSDTQFKGYERELQRLPDASDVLQIPLVASHTEHVSPQPQNSVCGGVSAATSSASLFRESLPRFSLYLKRQNPIPLILVIASVLILLMQLSIIVLLSKAPQVHLISQMDQMNAIGSSRNNMAETEAWLERRVHYLKDEMHMVEARLEKMRDEHALLKEHFKGLEQLRKARR